SRINAQGYVEGAPEMAVEIVANTAALDLKDKLETYRKFGVKEYLAWRTPEKLLYWFYLENGEYRPLLPDKDGIFRSRVFPGFWIGLEALLAGDRAAVIRVLKRGLKSAEHRAFCRK
ncbi:MAG TPA: Uma2 family endonuclease, partial [Planctomycetota bacterium]|nr:Uma2 family endonuclease [Planctomycetota bacterium]